MTSRLAPDDGRPRRPCPLCGRPVLVSCLFAHVGSEPCLAALQRVRDGQPADAERGPRILSLTRELATLLGVGKDRICRE